MTHWTQNNEVPSHLPNRLSADNRSLHLVCDASKAWEATMTRRFVIVLTNATAILLVFVALAVANAFTGQAQETEAGHKSAWMGARLAAREVGR
jgi:hypothetical protein